MIFPFNGVPVGTYTGVCMQIILYLRDDDLVHAEQRVSKSGTGQVVSVFLIFKRINTGKYVYFMLAQLIQITQYKCTVYGVLQYTPQLLVVKVYVLYTPAVT
jgi:hypothetical protein